MNTLINHPSTTYLNSIKISYTLDYAKINALNLQKIIGTLDSACSNPSSLNVNYVHLSGLETLKQYIPKVNELLTILWVIETPVILMIIFYVFMMSSLILDHDKCEISILKSRGASKFQIFTIYLGQNLILFLITILLSPLVSCLITKLLSSTSGFLKLIDRPSLNIRITRVEWIYSCVCDIAFLIIMFIPLMLYPKNSIVEQKRIQSRKKTSTLQKFYIDFIILGIGIYSVYKLKSFEQIFHSLKVDSANVPISPSLYCSFTILIIGVGLVAIRLYHYIVKFLFKLVKNHCNYTSYVCVTNITRTRGNQIFIMIFLIVTISTGLFNLEKQPGLILLLMSTYFNPYKTMVYVMKIFI